MKQLRTYLFFWGTQSLSTLGSAMTGYALVLWLYLRNGSALETALLSVCSYAPYVMMSIFAGALSDRWNKKRTLLVCDLVAALCTVTVFVLLKTDSLSVWHLYLLNTLNGLMNTIQSPAGEVASTLLVPPKYYQKTSGLRSLSQSLTSILTPIFSTALFTLAGLETVILFDLLTFITAFLTLLLWIRIPEPPAAEKVKESVFGAVRAGLGWLKRNPLILTLILFLAAINFVASIYDTVLPAMVLSKPTGGETALGVINACVGIASLVGSLVVLFLPKPKNRVKVVCLTLLLSMSTENFLLAFSNSPVAWCIGAVIGWIAIPLMNANLDVIYRSGIPAEMQGRVFACRNTMQFFTIPLGNLLGGFLVDEVFEPFMALRPAGDFLISLFGEGKGSGAAFLFFFCGIAGVAVCLIFGFLLRKYRWQEED